NEQPDKAIELFLHIAELDKDTFETQVALGHLFRRRGEVDRAIRLHQALVQRPDLTDQQKVQALLALGEDYMKPACWTAPKRCSPTWRASTSEHRRPCAT